MSSLSNSETIDRQWFDWQGNKIAFRQYGTGQDLVLLHGFPSSSRDWDVVGEKLAEEYRILQFDFLGYGDSDKPPQASYSAYRQADLAGSIIRERCSGPAILVGHDLGGIILQILLTGQFGAPDTLVHKAIFMNSSVYAALYRPTLSQRLLTTPVIGPVLANSMKESTFQKGVQATGGKNRDRLHAETRRMWRDFSSDGGKHLAPKHLVYMSERAKAAKELETAMESFGAKRLTFIYGDADPVSGLHQLDHIRSRIPSARTAALPELGHFPMLEDPDLVAAEIHKALEQEV